MRDLCFRILILLYSKWPSLCSAAAAYVVTTELRRSFVLPGADVSSQRAEIFAVAMVCQDTYGPLRVASDCLSVVRTFQWLQGVGFSKQWIHKLDNWDCWVLICDIMIARGGDVTIVKVKAHCKKGDAQHPYLTWGNNEADKDAKKAAGHALREKIDAQRQAIERTVAIQCHVISTLAKRFGLISCVGFEPPEPSPFPDTHLSRTCCCQPRHRVSGKSKICRGECCNVGPLYEYGKLESTFLGSCQHGAVSNALLLKIWTHYKALHDALDARVVQPFVFPPRQVDAIRKGTRRQPSCSVEYAQALINFSNNLIVSFTGPEGGLKLPWVLLFYEFVAAFPHLPEWDSNSKLHVFLKQFSSHFARMCGKPNFHRSHHCTNLRDLNFGSVSGVFGSFRSSCPLRVAYLCVHASLQVVESSRLKRKGPGSTYSLLVVPFDLLRVCPVNPS